MRKLIAVAIVAIAIVQPPAASGLFQEPPRDCPGIMGRVTDSTGYRLPGTTIVIENQEEAERQEVLTNESGEYGVCLEEGVYRVSAELPGWVSSRRGSIKVINGTLTVDFVLAVVPTEPGGIRPTG